MSVSEYSSGGSPGDELGADPDDISLSTEEVDLTAAGDDDSAVAENNAGPAGNWLKPEEEARVNLQAVVPSKLSGGGARFFFLCLLTQC